MMSNVNGWDLFSAQSLEAAPEIGEGFERLKVIYNAASCETDVFTE